MKESLLKMDDFFNLHSADYEQRHLGGIDGGMESKRILADYLPPDTASLIDLGVGTGLELDAIFKRFPHLRVRGVDVAEKMLSRLADAYPDRNIETTLGSYFTVPLGICEYDAAMSVMSLHHYTHAVKTDLYRRILGCLKPGGRYIECDFIITREACPDPQAVEDSLFAEYERLKSEQGLTDPMGYHFDTPCTEDNQIAMLRAAGFIDVRRVWSCGNTVVLLADKPKL